MNIKRIRIEEGTIAGEEKTSCIIFRGIPYAEAPAGKLRFQAPKKKEPWLGIYDATEFKYQCPQPDPTSGFYGKEFYTDPAYPLPEQNEDCLYLNIWTPSVGTGKKYPVALWIHGGAFDHGFGSEMEFDGEAFAHNGVILVTINYRVGVFGFFAHPDLKEEDPMGSVGNYGILDQVMAIRWIYDHISSFDGDPNKITIFGQSAGAMSVQTLISGSLTRDMIHGAIMQSGGGVDNGLTKALLPEEAYAVSEKIMKLCGAESVKEMRDIPAEKFVSILPDLYKDLHGLAFSPVIDGVVLTDSPSELAKRGRIYNIPYMLGITSDDITIEKGSDARKSAFYEGCIRFAQERLRHGNKPVYLYYFKRQLPSDDAGAFHSSELWYVFGTLGRCWRKMEPHDYKLSDDMISYWCSFIKEGDPKKGWKPFDEKGEFVRTFL